MDSEQTSGMRRALWLWAPLLLSVSSFQCLFNPPDPVAPRWDATFSLPIINRQYSLSEIVERDTSILRVGVGQQIIYATTLRPEPTILGDLLEIAPPETTVSIRFGTFAITAPTVVIPLGIPWLPQGVSSPIPDTTITMSNIQDTISSFERVVFEDGTITLELRNNLPVPMEVLDPIPLLDRQGFEILTFLFSPSIIPPNSSSIASESLRGKAVENVLLLGDMNFHTTGSQSPVPIPNGPLLEARVSTSNLTARQAVFAQIPPQVLVDNDTTFLPLDDSTLVQMMIFRTGRFDLDFTSRVDLDMVVRYRMDEMQRLVGATYTPYQDSIFLPARGTGSASIDLTGLRIRSLSADLLRRISVVSTIVLPNGSTTPVTVSDTDKVIIAMTPTPVLADTAIAVLKPTWIPVNTSFPVDFGDLPTRFSGGLNIPAAHLGFGSSSTLGFPLDLYVTVIGRTASGDSALLQVPAANRRIISNADVIRFDSLEVGRFLSLFSGQVPQVLSIRGDVLVNPPDLYTPTPAGTGRVGRNSSFGGTMNLEIPLFLGIVGGIFRDTVAVGDTTADGYRDFTFDKTLMEGVHSGAVVVEIDNAMPIEVNLSLRLLGTGQQQLLLLPQDGNGVLVPPAGVDGSGTVSFPARSKATIRLESSEIQQFTPAEFFTYSFSLRTTPGSPAVRFRTTDYVRVRSWASMKYEVNP